MRFAIQSCDEGWRVVDRWMQHAKRDGIHGSRLSVCTTLLKPDHIVACNAHDVDAWMATFAPDAMLNDIQREFVGTEAIRGFADKEIFGADVTMDVQRAADRYGDVTVHAKIDGTCDKTGLPDPLILSFYFSLRDNQITQLIILHNKAIG